jgi:hypothetical protein
VYNFFKDLTSGALVKDQKVKIGGKEKAKLDLDNGSLSFE